MTLINVTSNSVCLQFQFVNGSTPNIDIILLTDNRSYTKIYLISHNDQLNFTQCIDNIPAGNNLTLYPCELVTLDNCDANPPTVITGINITNDSTSLVVISSVHSSSVSADVSLIPIQSVTKSSGTSIDSTTDTPTSSTLVTGKHPFVCILQYQFVGTTSSLTSILSITSSFLTSSSFVLSSNMLTDCMISSTVTITRDDCNIRESQNEVPVTSGKQ